MNHLSFWDEVSTYTHTHLNTRFTKLTSSTRPSESLGQLLDWGLDHSSQDSEDAWTNLRTELMRGNSHWAPGWSPAATCRLQDSFSFCGIPEELAIRTTNLYYEGAGCEPVLTWPTPEALTACSLLPSQLDVLMYCCGLGHWRRVQSTYVSDHRSIHPHLLDPIATVEVFHSRRIWITTDKPWHILICV